MGKHFDFIIIDDLVSDLTGNGELVLSSEESKSLMKYIKKHLKNMQKTDNKTGGKTDNKEVKTTTKRT